MIIVDDIIKTIEGSSLYLSICDQITIIDLVYGLLLRSGNDAAVLIAENASESIDAFAMEMNQKAKEIGVKKDYTKVQSNYKSKLLGFSKKSRMLIIR